MKRTILSCALCISLMANAVAQSNEGQRPERPRMNRTEMVAQRTKQMVEKYNLNETQAKKLQELNEKTMQPMGNRRGEGRNRPDSTATRRRQRPATDGNTSASAQQQQQPQQRRPMNGNAFRERMDQYNKALKEIMTEEQYKAYEADMEKRRARRPQQ